MKVEAWAPVRPTEDAGKVAQAIAALFPDAVATVEADRVVARGGNLEALRRRIWELRIIDTFRGQFLRGVREGDRVASMRLSKQAALQGMVSFPPRPHALGDIEVRVEAEPTDPLPDAEALAWWLCPETKEGEIVGKPGVKPAAP